MIPAQIRILLVDDSAVDRMLVRSFLNTMKHLECKITESSSIDEAFQMLHQREFDVCIVDFYLKGREGSELITQANMFGVETPIVVMTGFPEYELDQTVMLTGADDFVAKADLSPELLERTIVHAIVRGQAKNKLLEDSRLDLITSSLSRREFLIQARFELLRCQRFKRTAGLLIVDIDGLSSINARYGHDAGDTVIRDLAARCRTIVRALDAIGRFGGDEVAILLPETPMDGTEIVAEKLRAAYDKEPTEFRGKPMQITLSIGATLLSPSHTTIEAAIHVAEKAVKQAQQHATSSYEFIAPPMLADRGDTTAPNL